VEWPVSKTLHSLLGPGELGPASGFSHGVLASPGRLLHVAGQVGSDASGAIVAGDIAAQLGVALGRVVLVLAAAGGVPEDVVSMVLYTTAMREYRKQRSEIGAVYRAHFGRHFPAMTLVAVAELVDPKAVIEVTAVAVVPDRRPPSSR
jgi:enamine deaminase RidA (YjgF/YER057c/UK114 family)